MKIYYDLITYQILTNILLLYRSCESSVAQTVCTLDSGPGGTGSIPDRVTRNKLWQVANFTLSHQRYGVNREPDCEIQI